jgi:hypothetical protein
MGNTATSSLAGANTNASQAGGNALTLTGNAGAGYTAQGANDIASSIGAGTNNALQAYILRNAFGNNGQGGGASAYTGSTTGGLY